MTVTRPDVFAADNAKLILFGKSVAQSVHGHRPLELIAALDGPIEMRVDGVGTLRGECFLVPPMRRHALAAYRGRIARLYFDPGYRRLTAWREAPVRDDMPGQAGLLRTLSNLFDSDRSEPLAHAVMKLWITGWIDAAQQPAPCDPRIVAALQYLDQQTTSPKADRRSVAARMGLSPTRFAALFAENTGMPLGRYLIWRRVKIALALICGGVSVTQAAAHAGFADGAHLTRCTRTTYGCPPSAIIGLNVSRSIGGTDPSETHACLAPHADPLLRASA